MAVARSRSRPVPAAKVKVGIAASGSRGVAFWSVVTLAAAALAGVAVSVWPDLGAAPVSREPAGPATASAPVAVVVPPPPLKELLARGKSLQSSTGSPFSAIDLYEAAAANLTALGKAANWGPLERATLLESLAELYTVVKQQSRGVAPRLEALALRAKSAQSTASELLLSHVALVDNHVAAMQYDQALATLRTARERFASGSAATSVGAGLLRVEASVRDCQGDSASAVELFERSLAGRDWPPRGGLTTAADLTLAKDHVKLLWRALTTDPPPSRQRSVALRDALDKVTSALVRTGPWQHPLQLPRTYVPGLRSSPWHSLDSFPPGLALIESALRDAYPTLRAEYIELKRRGLLLPETECIHDASSGSWFFYTVNAHWLQRRDERGCSLDTPAACALLRRIEALGVPNVQVFRGGYSAVGGRADLRPHFGITNQQLKFHLGLIVPHDADGSPCATLRVGNETRPWSDGGVLFFDDSWLHSVHNKCDAERVVFQLVFSHPDDGGGAASASRPSCSGH